MKFRVTKNHLKTLEFFTLHLKNIKALSLLFILSLFLVSPAFSQTNIVVKGRVTNEKNQPVSSASVVVKGTANGTTTNETGDFQLSVPANGTLVFSSVGYPTQEVAVKN